MQNGMGGDSYDCCGYDESSVMAVDTRNTKYQARMNHTSTAISSKSFNIKMQAKYMAKAQDKQERE